MPGGFEPQTDVRILSIPIDDCLEQSPLMNNKTLLVVPDFANSRYELLSVGFVAQVLPIDGSNDLFLDIEFVDDSASDAVTTIRTDFNMAAAGSTPAVYNKVWSGSQIMDAGDAINAEFDDTNVTTPDTASEGAALIVEYRVLKRS